MAVVERIQQMFGTQLQEVVHLTFALAAQHLETGLLLQAAAVVEFHLNQEEMLVHRLPVLMAHRKLQADTTQLEEMVQLNRLVAQAVYAVQAVMDQVEVQVLLDKVALLDQLAAVVEAAGTTAVAAAEWNVMPALAAEGRVGWILLW